MPRSHFFLEFKLKILKNAKIGRFQHFAMKQPHLDEEV